MSLIGWWPLHERNGNVTDLSGNGNNASLNGGITQGVAGVGGLTAYSFNGSDGYIQPSKVTPDYLTFSCWVRSPVGLSSRGDALSTDYVSEYGYQIRVYADSVQVRVNGSDSDTTAWVSHSTNTEGEWSLITGTYDGDILNLYYNGSFVGSDDSASGPVPYAGGETRIGAYGGSIDHYLEGEIADVRIYDRALSPHEVKTLYEWGSGDYTSQSLHDGSDSGTVSRWTFDGDVTDSWGSNDGTDNTSAGYTSNAIRGQAKSFDGTDDYVDIGYSTTANQLTVSMWCNFAVDSASMDSYANMLHLDSSNTQGFVISDSGGVYLDGEYADGSGMIAWAVDNEDSGMLRADTWHMFTWVIDGDSYYAYHNGVLNESRQAGSTNGDLEDVSGGKFGVSENEANWYNGDIDDVRIYNRALSQNEVFQLYQWGTRGRDMRKKVVNK